MYLRLQNRQGHPAEPCDISELYFYDWMCTRTAKAVGHDADLAVCGLDCTVRRQHINPNAKQKPK